MTFALKFTGLQAKDQYTPPFTSFLKNNHYYVKHFFFGRLRFMNGIRKILTI